MLLVRRALSSFRLSILTSVSVASISSRKLVFPLLVSFIRNVMRSRPVFARDFVLCNLMLAHSSCCLLRGSAFLVSATAKHWIVALVSWLARLWFLYCINLLLFISFSRCPLLPGTFHLMTNNFLVCILLSYNKCSFSKMFTPAGFSAFGNTNLLA